MSDAVNYKAFISYAHSDAHWAKRLHRKLENFRPPGHDGERWPLRPIFLDRSELGSSPDLSESIEKALQASDALIVVCSPAAAASRWVNEEVLFYKRLGRTSIFPIVIDGEPGSECFPEALRFQIDADGVLTKEPAEPLAADARKGQDGSDAILKIAAGLLNVPFDRLKLRQQRRRIRQALAVAAGATAMLVLTTFLAITAVVAKKDAEQRRDQAESLIAFMLGDLRQRVQEVGRLDVLDGVGEQALTYFSSLEDTELTSKAMLTRATALRQIGEVRVAQGLTTEGLVAFHEALDLLSRTSTDDEAVRLFELGQINYWIADAHFKALNLEQAQLFIERYLDISRELVAMEPANTDYQLELMYAESNLGTLAFRANEMEKARAYFENAVAVMRQLLAQQPSDENRMELARSVSWLGAVEAGVGNFSSALRWYEEELSLTRELEAANGGPRSRHELARSLMTLGQTYHQLGQLDRSVRAIGESVQIYRQLVAYDPQNFDWQRELAWTLTMLARDRVAAGSASVAQARATLAHARETIERVDFDAGAEDTRVAAAISSELGRIAMLDKQPQEAEALLGESAALLSPLVSGSDRLRVLPVYARAAYSLAEATQAGGRSDESRQIATMALDNIQVHASDPVEVRAYAALLMRVAGDPTAEVMLGSVAETEFRAPAPVPGTSTQVWWGQKMN